MEIKQNYYVYGKIPDKSNEHIILYHAINSNEKRKIGTLEGVFISMEPLVKEGEKVNPKWECIIKRSQMETFEEMYKGKFIPFEKD